MFPVCVHDFPPALACFYLITATLIWRRPPQPKVHCKYLLTTLRAVTISPFPCLDFLIYFIIYATSHTFWKGGQAEQEPSPFTI
ncbi:hypothetical protein DER44DRAFT_40914 [Fusarium oxysporum]|nr:hypothetical protein DER44DRAFT_40914 [Fusarium oxysporum]